MPAYEFNISFLSLTNYFGGKQEGLMENINVSVSPSCMFMSIATGYFLYDLQSHTYNYATCNLIYNNVYALI